MKASIYLVLFIGAIGITGGFFIGYMAGEDSGYFDGRVSMANQVKEEYNCYSKPNLTDEEWEKINTNFTWGNDSGNFLQLSPINQNLSDSIIIMSSTNDTGDVEILRLEHGGDIYVRGKLTTNDMEVVEGMRDFLNMSKDYCDDTFGGLDE